MGENKATPVSATVAIRKTGTEWWRVRSAAERPPRELDSGYWDRVARKVAHRRILPPAVSWLRRQACLDLLHNWCGQDLKKGRFLKTDCFEEAFSHHSAFMTIAASNPNAIAIDISSEISERARRRAAGAGLDSRILNCDVRDLPFASGTFDVVFSHSTLDHFPLEDHLHTSLGELRRVLKPSGQLVVTLDNSYNLGAPLVQLAKLVSPYFIGSAFSIERARKTFDRCGLTVEDATYFSHSIRILDIALFRLTNRLRLRRTERLGRDFLHSFNRVCNGSQAGALFGTYVALKARP